MKMKRLLAVLLSLAIMVTFMPMMAFADAPDSAKEAVQFNGDYSKVTVPKYNDTTGTEEEPIAVPEHTYKTLRVYDNATGAINVYIDPAEQADLSWPLPDITATYFDMNNAVLVDDSGNGLKAEYTNGKYTPGSLTNIKFNVPSYAANASADVKDGDTVIFPKAVAKKMTFSAFDGYTNFLGAAVGDEKIEKDERAEQSFTISFEGEYTADATDYVLFGAVPEKSAVIHAADPDPKYDADYYFDGKEVGTIDLVDSGSVVPGYKYTLYDGASHTFAATEVSGWTAAYSVYDKKTGKWNPTTAVTLSDIQEDWVYVTVDWTKAGDKTPKESKRFHVNLASAGSTKVEFVPVDDSFVYSVPGAEYDAASYIDAVPVVHEQYDTNPKTRAQQKFADAAITKAVAANKTELMAYFNEKYEVKATPSKYNPNQVGLLIVAKDLTTDEVDKIDEKYASLMNKFAVVDPTAATAKKRATVALNGVDLSDYEIEFVQAPAKKTIKTKKAKTTKKATINVKAECKNGTVVKYKLINAPKKNITIDATTGKITVKKGTPKGTYTFKVKAYIPKAYVEYMSEFMVFENFSETQTIKVIVKKTKK